MTEHKDEGTESKVLKLILEAGYECCSSVNSVRDLLASQINMDEKDVAQVLGCMARTHINMTGVGSTEDTTGAVTWNVENFVTVVKEKVPELNWLQVFERLDYPHFFLFDGKGLDILVKAWVASSGPHTDFPVNVFFGEWKNLRGQLTALYQIAIAPFGTINAVKCSRKAVIGPEDFSQSSVHIRNMASQFFNNQLNSLDLIERIVRLADTSVAADAKALLEKILIKKSPELLFMGLVQIEPFVNSVHEEVLSRLISFYLAGNPSSVMVMTKFYKVNPDLFKKSIIDLYSKEPTSLTRILAFAHEIKVLPIILDSQPFLFTIDLAALATRREYLNLEKWLSDKIAEHGQVFSQACLKFLGNKVRAELARQDANTAPTTVPLSMDVVNVFVRMTLDSLSLPEKDLLRDIHSTYIQLSQKSMILEQTPEVSTTTELNADTDKTVAGTLSTTSTSATTAVTLPNTNAPGEATFKQEIEDEANSYYERIYNGEITVDGMIERLIQFSTSTNPHEQDVFACMIHNLFDEYNFFPKYPDRELSITSILFGQLVEKQLVSFAPLGIALRYVLDALSNPPGSKMYNFGIQALTQFQSRLPEWPQYCAHLLQINAIQQTNPDLAHAIKYAMHSRNALQQEENDSSKELVKASPPQVDVFTAVHVPEIAVDESIVYEAPTGAIQDRILFTINNVALNNLESKCNDLKDNLRQSAYQWFSNYLVVKRASIEPNYHELYILLLKSVDSSLLYQHVLRETFANIKILLNSESTVSSSTERSLLKNLGAWLGGMTLAQNKPIIQKYIAFKELLLEGYDHNRLIVVIPFVCKVLEQGSKNTVFVPPNPWVTAILRLLVELYQNADLKLNLKFEIEVLCKSLSVELSNIKPSVSLKNRQPKNRIASTPATTNSAATPPPPTLAPVNNTVAAAHRIGPNASPSMSNMSSISGPSLSNPMMNANIDTGLGAGMGNGIVPSATPVGRNVPMLKPSEEEMMMNNSPFARSSITNLISSVDSNLADEDAMSINVPNIGPYLSFNSQILMYTTQPNSKRWVLQAITQSIREIIGPVVERSVAIASVTTKELVTKDFSMESDESRMRKAAHLMAQSLASSLALVTCKDPLRTTMANHLRVIFISNGLSEIIAEQAAMMTVADNLDLACAVIEQAAMEKVTMEVDETLMAAFASRKKHREHRGNNQPYFDMEFFNQSHYPATLPEPLRPKPNGLQPSQLRIYEDFVRIPRSASGAASSAGQVQQQQQQRMLRNRSDLMYLNGFNNNASNSTNNTLMNFDNTVIQQQQQQQQFQQQANAHQLLERFVQYINELEKLIAMTNAPSFNSLPMQHDIVVLIRQIPLLASSSFDKTEAARMFAQKVVQLLYKSETQLGREVYVVLLERLCDISPNVSALVTSWLTHADDERKYNVPVTVALIKANLINLLEQDQELANLIDSGRLSAIDFTARLIRACLFDDIPLASRQEFMASLEAISRLRGNVPESVLMLMDDMRRRMSSNASTPLMPQDNLQPSEEADNGLREHLRILFSEWVRIYHHPTSSEKVLNAFVIQLSQQGILKMEDVSSLFYRICIETSIEHAIKFKQLPGQPSGLAYQPIDAFSKLVVNLLKLQQPSTPVGTPTAEAQDASRITLLNKVLSIVVLVAAQHHEQRQQQFNQRPFLRLFNSLFSDLHAAEQEIQTVYIPILTAMSNTFNTLQPLQFPGFTFAWIQLISHRLFMPKLLLAENQKGWPAFQRLLICVFKFIGPFLEVNQLKDTTRLLYRGVLRVLLVLLHDFPEFLCDYHYSLCDVIPASCIQLRNLILSAFPRNMRLPDPFTPNLKIDLLPEISQSPNILSDYTSLLLKSNLKQELDTFLTSAHAPESFLKRLPSHLMLEQQRYNTSLINALVFYTGVVGVNESMPVNQGAPIEIFQYLLNELDSEGRYVFLNAIANQLRYPNSHTHYFSCVILFLFAETNKDFTKEQITRVLLERLIVNRPHPWGLLITFIELIKNPRYSFWSHSFTRCATDIERLFESVSRSINQI
ncbi:CCR4-Not complex component, Not1-domain-containing protein [Blakeslea trispora]|nr:CCR4-Not complex component, Not1-domain-containing protein [Blakeslea trispora]